VEPRITETLDRYTEALGGKATVEGVTTRVAKGSFEMTDLGTVGTIETYAKAPNKFLLVMNVSGMGVARTGFNGSVGWVQELGGLSMRRVEGAELAAMKRDADFYREVRLKELFSKLTFAGKLSVDGHDTNVIEATAPEGGFEKWYFDTQTGLLIRAEAERAAQKGFNSSQTSYEQYQKVDGINMPFTLRQVVGGGKFVIKLNQVTHNVPINDAVFNMPSN
jgi:hypothetical protein